MPFPSRPAGRPACNAGGRGAEVGMHKRTAITSRKEGAGGQGRKRCPRDTHSIPAAFWRRWLCFRFASGLNAADDDDVANLLLHAGSIPSPLSGNQLGHAENLAPTPLCSILAYVLLLLLSRDRRKAGGRKVHKLFSVYSLAQLSPYCFLDLSEKRARKDACRKRC